MTCSPTDRRSPDAPDPESEPPALGLLVGGESRRFGGSKLSADLAGTPLLVRVAARLSPVAARRFLVGTLPPGLAVPEAWTHLPDPWQERHGPLAGWIALARVSPGGFLVTAGDMPLLDATLLLSLWEGRESAPAAAIQVAGDRYPLPAAVGPAGATLLAPLEPPDLPGPRRWLEEAGAVWLGPDRLGRSAGVLSAALSDVDTREDLARIAAEVSAQ